VFMRVDKCLRGRCAVILVTLLVAGCGGGQLKLYPVTGKVTLTNGKPVAGASVRVESLDAKGKLKRITAHGVTDNEGVYHLTTVTPDDGALAGKHVVAIDNPFVFSKSTKPKRDPDDPDMVGKELQVIHSMYSDFTGSGLKLEVSTDPAQNTGKDFVLEPYQR